MSDYISKWHKELGIFSKIKPLIILEGNVLDSYQYPEEGSTPKGSILRLPEYLHFFFKDMGYQNIVFYDKVLSGDIDTYLQLIYEVNPLDDLLAYGGNFEFGTDNPSKIEVEFTVNENALSSAKRQLSATEYNNLLQDYICSVCIRIARDMFALLPVAHTLVHAVLSSNTIISVDFDRVNLSKVKFGYIDPSDTLSLFKHNMNYNDGSGFAPVANLE